LSLLMSWEPGESTVNTVSPGATDTDMLRSLNSTEELDAMAQMGPLGRIGQLKRWLTLSPSSPARTGPG
jgi:NAD(P)-dependent dehydrogenase (short-subunit alcohol dehydrogenase family)